MLTFPTLCRLSNGTVLAAARAGSGKDTDDETVVMSVSHDDGRSFGAPFQPFPDTVDCFGTPCRHRMSFFTEIGTSGHVIASIHASDRTTYPGSPLFNEETEGAVPMHVVLYDSYDYGSTWGPARTVPLPAWAGPASNTSPLIPLEDGTLVLSDETNKHYDDAGPWKQRVALFRSADLGHTWDGGTDVCTHHLLPRDYSA